MQGRYQVRKMKKKKHKLWLQKICYFTLYYVSPSWHQTTQTHEKWHLKLEYCLLCPALPQHSLEKPDPGNTHLSDESQPGQPKRAPGFGSLEGSPPKAPGCVRIQKSTHINSTSPLPVRSAVGAQAEHRAVLGYQRHHLSTLAASGCGSSNHQASPPETGCKDQVQVPHELHLLS